MYRVIDKGEYILVKEWTWVARELDVLGRRALTFVEYYELGILYIALSLVVACFFCLLYLFVSRKDG